MDSLFKNLSLSYVGTGFNLAVTIVLTAVYVRVIGLEGYAVIGIAMSLMNTIQRFDIPYYLKLVRDRHFLKETDANQGKMVASFHSWILSSNMVLGTVLFPLVVVIALWIHDDPTLILFYIMGILSLFLSRAVNLFYDIYRSRKREYPLYQSSITQKTLELVLALYLLFFAGWGVMGVFAAMVFSQAVQLFMLYRFSSTEGPMIESGSSAWLALADLRGYTGQAYLRRIYWGAFSWGGLFIATFMLPPESIGILTILVSLSFKAKDTVMPLIVHVFPLHSSSHSEGADKRTAEILGNLSSLFLILSLIGSVLLITWKEAYLLYFGGAMEGTYPLLLILGGSSLVWLSLLPWQYHVLADDIWRYNRIFSVMLVLFFMLEVALVPSIGLIGAVVAYAAANVFQAAAYVFEIWRTTDFRLKKNDIVRLTVVFLLLAAAFFIELSNLALALVAGLWLGIGASATIALMNAVTLARLLRFSRSV